MAVAAESTTAIPVTSSVDGFDAVGKEGSANQVNKREVELRQNKKTAPSSPSSTSTGSDNLSTVDGGGSCVPPLQTPLATTSTNNVVESIPRSAQLSEEPLSQPPQPPSELEAPRQSLVVASNTSPTLTAVAAAEDTNLCAQQAALHEAETTHTGQSGSNAVPRVTAELRSAPVVVSTAPPPMPPPLPDRLAARSSPAAAVGDTSISSTTCVTPPPLLDTAATV